MCVHITPASPTAVQRMTGLEPVQDYPAESFPGYVAPIIRADAEAASGLRVDLAVFGLIPSWSKDRSIGRRTYNARTETVAEKPSYRTAWRQRQFCLVPVEGFLSHAGRLAKRCHGVSTARMGSRSRWLLSGTVGPNVQLARSWCRFRC